MNCPRCGSKMNEHVECLVGYKCVQPNCVCEVVDAAPDVICWCGKKVDFENCVVVMENGKGLAFCSGECYR